MVLTLVLAVASPAIAQQGGFRGGRGMGEGMQNDMSTLHAMFANRDKIQRRAKKLPDGALAITESDDEAVAAMIKDHVPHMDNRVLKKSPLPPMTFHPVFVALIENADKYALDYEERPKGVRVTYQSDDSYVIRLTQEHAKLVGRFIKNGMAEIHKPYSFPKNMPQPAPAEKEST